MFALFRLLLALTVAAARLRVRNYMAARSYAAGARHRAEPVNPAVFEVREVVRLGNGCHLYSLNGRGVFVHAVA